MDQSARDYDLSCHGEAGEFIDRLMRLSSDEWISAVPDPRYAPSDASLSTIESLIGRTGQQVAAWCVADEVETAAHLAFRCSAGDPRMIARKRSAIRAAERAALALLLRSDLSAEEFERLYRPFKELIPLRDLGQPGAT